MTNSTIPASILVVGATGMTGRHVVQQLLDQGKSVSVIVRCKERMMQALEDDDASSSGDKYSRLDITEASLLDLTDQQLQEHVTNAQAVVSCLGHNLTFKGMYGHPRRLVTDAAKRLTSAMIEARKIDHQPRKFIMMGSDGVANPAGTDNKRSFSERIILSMVRYLVPPHADNEEAAAYVHSLGKSTLEWVVVRPTDLIDGPVTEYQLYDKPKGSLFGSGTATRANVAKGMVDLLTRPNHWSQFKYTMPVLHDVDEAKK